MSTRHHSKLFGYLSLTILALSAATISLPCWGQAPSDEAAKPAAAPAANPSVPEQASNTQLPVIKTESRIVLVDAVVTDKKGNYIHDLSRNDFKVYEDNKEQSITSFSFGASGSDPAVAGQKRYLVLFFDNSSMDTPDQLQARAAASKFVENNAGGDRVMAVAEFGGSLQIRQNFTANAELLKAAVSGVKTPYMQTNGQSALVASNAPMLPGDLSRSERDLGVHSMLLSIRSLAKNLRAVPGRKMLILFSAGFALDSEGLSEMTATIDACNKANVAIYSLDVRGLVATAPGGKPGGSAQLKNPPTKDSTSHADARSASNTGQPRLTLASYSVASDAGDPQRPGGGGAPGGGGGGKPGGGAPGGGAPSGGAPSGGAPGGGKGTTGGTSGGKPGGTPGGPTGTRGTGPVGTTNPNTNFYNANNPMNQPRSIIPSMPPSVAANQQILQMLAQGTGGFVIMNTNDLLGGLERMAREQNEFYLIGYVPQASSEGACHTLKVKMNKGGTEVRSRSGYCNARPADPLEGKPLEKQMEVQAMGSQPGTIQGAMQVPYFYSAPNVARVNLAMDIPGDSLTFNKDKGKYHANVNVLGIAYKPDGTVGARFSDTLNLDLEKDDWQAFTKKPYHYENQFDASPGTYKLTVVFGAGGEHFGKFEAPLQIEPYDGKNLTLGGVVLSTSIQRVDQIPMDMDAALLEDHTPLIIKGMQVTPAARYQFKKSDNVVLYSELYSPQLKSDKPPKIAAGYRVFEKASNKQIVFTGAVPLEDFVQKGNAVVPFGMNLQVKDLQPGSYRLVLLAVDDANNHAPARETEFSITD
jgi:VWFA-related protein